MNNSVCICIPKVNDNITKHDIKTTINSYNIGNIKKINLVYSKEKNKLHLFI